MNNKFKFKNKVSNGINQSEDKLRYDYTKKYGHITGNINHEKNVHGTKEITIFYKDYEGIQLLKNVTNIIIITPHYTNKIIDDKITRRINKLKKINKNVDITNEHEIFYGCGGLMSLIAYGNQDHHFTDKPNITHYKANYSRQANFEQKEIVVTNNSKIKREIKKIYRQQRNNKINKNANKFRNSGR